MEDDKIMEDIMEETEDTVNWIKTGLKIAKKDNKSLEDMIDILKCGWGMCMVFETFSKKQE